MKQQLLDLWRDVRGMWGRAAAWCVAHWLYVVIGCMAVCLVAIGAMR